MEHLGQRLLRHHRRDHSEISPRLVNFDQTWLRHGGPYHQMDLGERESQERAQRVEDEGKQRDGRHEGILQTMREAVHSHEKQYPEHSTRIEGLLEEI